MTRTLWAASVALALACAVPARGAEPEYLVVHDVSAVVGCPDAALEEAVRAEVADDPLSWLATLVQARREVREAEGQRGERGLSVREIARWLEIRLRANPSPALCVRPAVHGVCVVGTEAAHRRAAGLIDGLRRALWASHRFEVSLLSYAPAFLSRIDTSALVRLGEGNVPGFRLRPDQAASFVAGLSSGSHHVDRGQGVVTVAWGEEGRFSLVRDVTHAAVVETRFAFGRVFGVPRPGQVEDGMWFKVRVSGARDGAVEATLDIDTALLAGLEAFGVPAGTVEVPSILRRALAFEERMMPGEAVGILGLDDPFAVTGSPRGRRAGGVVTNLAVVVRYLGKQPLLADAAGLRSFAEPDRRMDLPGPTDGPVNEIYDVRDLVVNVPDVVAALSKRERDTGEAAGRAADDPEGTRLLAGLVTDCVLPAYWTSTPGTFVQAVKGGHLAVSAAAPVQEAVAVLLRDLRDLESTLVGVRVHLVASRLNPGVPRASHLLASLARNRTLGSDEVASLLEQAGRADAPFRVVSAPALSVFQGQKASILVADQMAYLQDHTLEDGPSGAVLQPVVGTLQEGVLLQLRATALPGGEWIRITGSLEVARLDEPVHKHPFGVPSDDQGAESIVTLEMPNCRRVLHGFTLVVRRDQTAIVGVPGAIRDLFAPGSDPGVREELYLLVRANAFDARQAAMTADPPGTEPK